MDLLKLIAKSADVCLKPWIHAVVPIDPSAPAVLDDLNVRIECRDPQGERCPERDLELEIYRSGNDINLMLSWWDYISHFEAIFKIPFYRYLFINTFL